MNKDKLAKHVYRPGRILGKDYISLFNGNNGTYARIPLHGKKDEDIFMAEFPELIDIGIMETCVCSHKCKVGCYQNAAARHGKNMSLADYEKIMQECFGRTFQVALGGAGDPDTHEEFEGILKLSAKYNIVPNFTTSGICMNEEKAKLCYKYCGAVAISEHFADYTDKAVKILLDNGVKTNIHYVLNTDTIGKAIEILKGEPYRKGINAVVFLLYKPVGLGDASKVLREDNPKVKEFFSLIEDNQYKTDFKIGFDSCSCSGLVNYSKLKDYSCLDFCEGGRFSMYISADMKAYPCSFANQTKSGFDITDKSIKEAWDNFDYFRNRLKYACPNCKDKANCSGGCPLLSSITLCKRECRTNEKGLIE